MRILRPQGAPATLPVVLYIHTIHDFVTLNALADTAAARGAMAMATRWLREGLAGGR